MKVLFLDIDGVLIPIRTKEEFEKEWIWKMKIQDKSTWIEWNISLIRKESAQNLIRILKETWTKIVISSSWRHNWEWCRDLLQSIEFDWESVWDYVISRTWSHTWGWRSTEIMNWINEYNQTCKKWYHVSHWVALDDEGFDMKCLNRIWKLVKTNGNVWLSDKETDLIISILNA